jgi:molecular chaperone HscB
MNYFTQFGLPVQFTLDKDVLRRQFFELSRKYHPDYFAQFDEAAQAQALEDAASLNKAYKTLSNEDERIRYILEQKGLIETDEKYALAPDFLMEMLELNESIEEAKDNPVATAELVHQLQNWKKEIYEPVAEIVAHYQEGVSSEKELLQVKEYYFRKKYLQRLAGQLGQKL